MMGGGGKIPEYLDFGVRISSLIRTLGIGWGLLPTLPCHPASTIGALQSKQAMWTSFVARTELPQQGQIYFLVLDVRGGGVAPSAPLCVPVPVIWNPANSLRLMRMSVKPFSNMKSSSSSEGLVWLHPYLSLCSTIKPWASAATLKRRLW